MPKGPTRYPDTLTAGVPTELKEYYANLAFIQGMSKSALVRIVLEDAKEKAENDPDYFNNILAKRKKTRTATIRERDGKESV